MPRRRTRHTARAGDRTLGREALLAAERRRFEPSPFRRSDRLFVLAYPNSYWIGMSNLGFQVIRRLAEQADGWRVERAFAEQPTGREGPRTFESQAPLTSARVLGLALATELDAPGLARMLFLAGVPVLAEARSESDPIVLLGGAAPTLNPEPYALIADAIAIGEAEAVLPRLLEVLGAGLPRQERLEVAARLPGVYVPSLASTEEIDGWMVPHSYPVGLPWPVVADPAGPLEALETASDIVTPHTEFSDVRLIEVARGCSRGCRFCVVPPAYGRARFRSVESVVALAEGEHRIGLLGAAAADHPRLSEMVATLREAGHDVTLSASRVDVLRPEALAALAAAGQRTLTIAPETTDTDTQERIGKRLPLERVREIARTAHEVGFGTLKLYFMLGLPGSGPSEAREIASFVEGLLADCGPVRLAVSAGPFVPKPRTSLEREAFAPRAELRARIRELESALRRLGPRVEPRLGSPRHAEQETILSRADRRAGRALAALASTRDPGLQAIEQALEEVGLSIPRLLGEIPPAARLPWEAVTEERDHV